MKHETTNQASESLKNIMLALEGARPPSGGLELNKTQMDLIMDRMRSLESFIRLKESLWDSALQELIDQAVVYENKS